MPFQNKDIPLPEFLGQVRRRVEQTGGDLTLFDATLKTGLGQEFRGRLEHPESWDGLVNAGDFSYIYPLAAEMLRSTASTLYSEAHPDIYKAAHGLSEAFCGQLNDTFQATEEHAFEVVPIKSWAEMLAEAGFVTIENGMVKPVPSEDVSTQGVGRERAR